MLNQYASTPGTGIGGRHYSIARELVKVGYKVRVVAASYAHTLHNPPTFSGRYKTESLEGLEFTWVNVPSYSDAHSPRRVLNWFRFAWHLLGLKKYADETPDVILYSSLSLVGALTAAHLARHYKCLFVFEVRDIWPRTLMELGHYSSRHPFVSLLQWIEDRTYKNADVLISNLPNCVEHMVSRGADARKFSWIPNGISLDELSHLELLPPSVRAQIPEVGFIVGYTGTVGVANALEDLVSAAYLLREYKEIAFVIVGAGKELAKLKANVCERALTNVFFVDPVPKSYVQSVISLFDVCYIGWKCEPIYRFGIAANKLAEYLYSGKPIIHAYSGTGDPVQLAGAGISVKAEEPTAIAEAVIALYRMDQAERLSLGGRGRAYALAEYDYKAIAKRLIDSLEAAISYE